MKNKSSRLAYIDNLRTLIIILVVMMHAAVTYSGFGMWYYMDNKPLDLLTAIFFGIFQSFTQAYFMSLLFMIAGYFVPMSIDRNGVKSFIRNRLFRLGIPIFAYIFFIHPISVAIARPNMNIVNYYLHGILSFQFVSWTGPLWFALALLIFTFTYLLIRRTSWCSKLNIDFKITPSNILLLIFLITVAAFLIRLIFPIGTEVINLQFSYFSAYVMMFMVGIVSYHNGLFDKINYGISKKFLGVSVVIGLPFWLSIVFFGGPIKGIFLINGGFNWQAFAYALWESFFCVAFSLGLLGFFKERFNSQNAFQKFLADNAFGVYVFHAPILIGTSVLLKGFILDPILKFIFVSSLAVSLSFIFSSLIRRIGFLRKVFS